MANCTASTCGAHGTLASNASTPSLSLCSCVCASGWATSPNQDLFNPVFCGVTTATLATLGNPPVAAGAVPATALSSAASPSGLTPAGWALIVGIVIACLLAAVCFYRCVEIPTGRSAVL